MIDTVKIMFSKGMFTILDKDMFEKSKIGVGYATYVINPTKKDRLKGIYKPRLTLTNRFNTSGRSEETLSVELSLPKLLFGNNFDELNDEDFPAVVTLLHKALKSMRIMVFEDVLVSAPISAIHYSKNIPLTDGLTPHYLISKIKEANISLALDVNQTDYRNGYSYKWHCNSYEVAFYDKIKDLENAKNKGEKRAFEDGSIMQLDLFDSLKQINRFEVLRMEARLNTRRKIKQLLAKLDIDKEITFKNLFSSEISQKVLIHYLDEIESQRPAILDYKATSTNDLLAGLVINNPELSPLKILQFFGLKQALEEMTLREIRTMFGNYSRRSWYRLIAETRKIQAPSVLSPFRIVREHLVGFEPLKLVDFQVEMLNNDKYR